MKYIIKDNDGEILLETNKKREIDSFIEVNSEYNEFYGFYYENDKMIIQTSAYDVIIKGE